MEKADTHNKKRNIFKTSSKYQEHIILLSFLPSVMTFLVFIIIVFAVNPIITKAVFHNSSVDISKWMYDYSWVIIFVLCTLLFLSLAISFIISLCLVGAFKRIISEMDEVINGHSQRPITCRPKDYLAQELLNRINVLIDFYVKNKK